MNKLKILCWIRLFTTTFNSSIKMDEFKKMKVPELKAIAKQRKIPKYYEMNKTKLIEVLGLQKNQEHQSDLLDSPILFLILQFLRMFQS